MTIEVTVTIICEAVATLNIQHSKKSELSQLEEDKPDEVSAEELAGVGSAVALVSDDAAIGNREDVGQLAR